MRKRLIFIVSPKSFYRLNKILIKVMTFSKDLKKFI